MVAGLPVSPLARARQERPALRASVREVSTTCLLHFFYRFAWLSWCVRHCRLDTRRGLIVSRRLGVGRCFRRLVGRKSADLRHVAMALADALNLSWPKATSSE